MASSSMYAPKPDQASSSNSTGPLDHADDDEQTPPPHPFLSKPMLYLADLDAGIADKELASSVFSACLPVRLQIDRSEQADSERLSGTVEFQTLDKAEKALATIRSPRLSVNQDAAQDPKPSAKPRLIKQLPFGTEDSDVYDLFRPYGALESASRILTNPQGHHTGFRGMALVIYYSEEDAQRAQTEMHCAEVEGKTISVVIDNVARRPSAQAAGGGISASAAPFVPGSASSPLQQSMSANAPAFHPPQPQKSSPLGSPMFVPGTNLQYSANAATYVDPCNLFCKNLDPAIDSNELFTLFKGFGKIVSARVMRDDRGVSREFGFVSYRRAEDANRAMNAMNGTQHGTKSMIVRLHEPKNLRQEKLSHKFGAAYAPDSPNEAGSAGNGSDAFDSPSIPAENADGVRSRRMSNSYFRAAASGEGGQVDLGQLQSMNATLRGDILRGGFSRKMQDLGDVTSSQADAFVAELSKLKLSDAVEALNDTNALSQRVAEIRESGKVGSSDSMLGVPKSSSGDASSITSTAGPAGTGERARLLAAVKERMPAGSPVEDITDMLAGLPKKERAMALFNQEYLRTKIDEAKQILDLADDEAEPVTSPTIGESIDVGRTNGGATASTTTTTGKAYTLADLAKLSATEIVQLASNPQSAGLPLPKADASVVQETDAFIDSLKDMAPHDQKQKLGDQLFKKIRTFGFKGAPKITIALLDSEDLRSLAHLMNSYPECLREKVALQATKSTK